jgi:malic enzyme
MLLPKPCHPNQPNVRDPYGRSANVFIGVSGPGTLQAKHLRRMAPKSIVFALANPTLYRWTESVT